MLDTTKLIQAYHEQGYCIIRNMIDQDELAWLINRHELAITGKLDPNIHIQIEPGHENHPAEADNPWQWIRKISYFARYDSGIRDFVTQPKFLSLAQQLLSSDIKYMGDESQLKPPRIGSAHPWHQDQPYYSGLMDHFATFWLALDPATKANGCMQVIPGSHKQGIITRRNNTQSWFDDDEIDTANATFAQLDPGDVLIFHSLILHGSDRNETDSPRRSFIFRYMDVSNLPTEHWPLLRKHGVVLDDENAHPIFQDHC